MGFYDFGWAGGKAFSAIRALMRPHYELARVDGDERPFLGATNAWAIDAMVMTSGYRGSLRFTRTARLIRADQCDDLILQFVKRGTVRGDFDGTQARVTDGQILCYDRARPVDICNSDNISVTLTISRMFLDGAGVSLNRVHGRILRGAASQLLQAHLRVLADLDGLECDDGIATATLALTASALGQLPQPQVEQWSSLGLRALHLIDERLGSERLRAETICQGIGISRSALYRQFQNHGGVERYIIERRLTVARNQLMEGSGGSIGNLALDFGFRIQSHFSTAYRARFGMRPRDTTIGSVPDVKKVAVSRVEHWARLTEAFS